MIKSVLASGHKHRQFSSVMNRGCFSISNGAHVRLHCCRRTQVSHSACSGLRRSSRPGRIALSCTNATPDSGRNAKLREPNGSFGLPLLGESLEWLKDLSGFFAERCRAKCKSLACCQQSLLTLLNSCRHEKHGMVFKSHIFGNKTVIISDPMQICRWNHMHSAN